MANMLYNGVELPDIESVWTDKVTWPYAVIVGGGVYSTVLYVSNAPFTVGSTYLQTGASCKYRESYFKDGSWGELSSDRSGNNSGIIYPNYTIWANHDVLMSNGTVYLAASDPVDPNAPTFTPADFLRWFSLGQAVRRGIRARGEATMYSYNGTVLPKLPQWNKTKYPYAAITYDSTDALVSGSYAAYLIICENPLTAISSAQILNMGTYINGKCLQYMWVSDEKLTELGYTAGLTDSWGYDGEKEYENYKFSKTFKWSNHDILYTNVEGVKLAASEPVPVYE